LNLFERNNVGELVDHNAIHIHDTPGIALTSGAREEEEDEDNLSKNESKINKKDLQIV